MPGLCLTIFRKSKLNFGNVTSTLIYARPREYHNLPQNASNFVLARLQFCNLTRLAR
nr:MAG TPA: hypothetical protein [Caudoviricetes sp.]